MAPPVKLADFSAVLHAFNALQTHMESRLSTRGLSVPKLAALHALSTSGESMPLGQLADRLACVRSNVTQLVDRLQGDGPLPPAPDPKEPRRPLPRLPAAGGAALQGCKPPPGRP